MFARYSALEIARWFLGYNDIRLAENGGDCISNLKLQKLLYYAQGAYVGITGYPLFDDDILAWAHGPVVEKVYHNYKEYGSEGISLDDDFTMPLLDDEAQAILVQVYDVFGQYSAWKLREMTHDETPWRETPQNHVIPLDKISDYFLQEYISD